MSFISKHLKRAHVPGWVSDVSAFLGDPIAAYNYDKKQGGKIKHYSLWSNHAEQKANDESRRAALAANQTTGQNLDTLHSLFGSYSGPNQALADESGLNLADRNAGYDKYHKAYLDYFSPQLNDQFNTANHNDLFAAVRSGTQGGSADALRQGNTLNTYVGAQQNLGSKANKAVNDLRAGDNSLELDLSNQIQHGGDAAYLLNSGIRGSLQSLNSAQDAIPGEAIGDVFNNAGNLYEQSQIAQGNGRRGLGTGLLTGT